MSSFLFYLRPDKYIGSSFNRSTIRSWQDLKLHLLSRLELLRRFNKLSFYYYDIENNRIAFEEDPDYFVLEMSSYQLEDLEVSPSRAIFLNIYEEHLDYHKTFDSYLKAKAKIGKFQKEGDKVVLPSGNDTIR